MECRSGCGACCTAPSISSPIPGMPQGKQAGERCVQLDESNFCRIFGRTDRSIVCGAFQADIGVCGITREEAMNNLIALENVTA